MNLMDVRFNNAPISLISQRNYMWGKTIELKSVNWEPNWRRNEGEMSKTSSSIKNSFFSLGINYADSSMWKDSIVNGPLLMTIEGWEHWPDDYSKGGHLQSPEKLDLEQKMSEATSGKIDWHSTEVSSLIQKFSHRAKICGQ
ncbi:hypothetical protein DFH07DRAFT_777843 [Mycena maculata]|uniref:Uncharacterized protein n=1 Tax=Mycena maculata TaxID=230809 RepID=A0AAD7IH91_9AGAR|nr:hypothetical protein DFH07DRAFT_777843 [Mycena maculata]